MTSHFQDGGHDVRPPLAVRRLPAIPPGACDVIGSLCPLRLLIHITLVFVDKTFTHIDSVLGSFIIHTKTQRPTQTQILSDPALRICLRHSDSCELV